MERRSQRLNTLTPPKRKSTRRTPTNTNTNTTNESKKISDRILRERTTTPPKSQYRTRSSSSSSSSFSSISNRNNITTTTVVNTYKDQLRKKNATPNKRKKLTEIKGDRDTDESALEDQENEIVPNSTESESDISTAKQSKLKRISHKVVKSKVYCFYCGFLDISILRLGEFITNFYSCFPHLSHKNRPQIIVPFQLQNLKGYPLEK